MSAADDDKDSLEFEIDFEGLDDENEPADGDRPTPSDTREAINAAVLRAERYSRKAAFYSFKAYQIAVRGEQRLEAVEREVANIKRQGFMLPNALSTGAFLMAFVALLLVGSLLTGHIEAPVPHRETPADKRR